MTTNIKLFENWIAEEEAAETPVAPTAATTPTAAPTAATTPTGTPAMAPPYKLTNIIGGGKNISRATVSISSPTPVFDINKSTLRVTLQGTNPSFSESVDFKYENGKFGNKAFGGIQKLVDYLKAIDYAALSLAKQTLGKIVTDTLALVNPPQTADVIGTDLNSVIAQSYTKAYRGMQMTGSNAPNTGELFAINSKLKYITITPEVEIDTNKLTSQYNYQIVYMKNSTEMTKNGKISVGTTDPVKTIIDQIISVIEIGTGGDPSVVRAKLQPVITRQLTNSQAAAVVPITVPAA